MKVLSFVVLLLSCRIISAQPIKELKVGETISSNFLQQLQEKAGGIPLQGKTIILEFWNTSCAACIASMPKLDSLQQKYSREVQFIFITTNTDEQVDHLFRRIRIQKPSIPFVNNDQVFSQYFPYEGAPYVVILQGGKVRNKTFGYNINDNSLKGLIDSPASFAIMDRTGENEFNPQQPVWEHLSFKKDSLSIVSSLSGRLKESSKSYTIVTSDTASYGLRFINYSLLGLYQIALGKGVQSEFDYSNRLQIDSTARSLLRPLQESELDKWKEHNVFSYEVRAHPAWKEKIFEKMQRDLLVGSNYNVRIEKQKRQVLLLVKLDARPLTAFPSIKSELSFRGDSIILQNCKLDRFVRRMNAYYQDLLPPIFDATGISHPITLIIHSSIENLVKLKAALQRCGFDLVTGEREVEMLVISKRI